MTHKTAKAFSVIITVLFSIITILYLVDTIRDLTYYSWDVSGRYITYLVFEILLSFALPILLGLLNFFMYKKIFEDGFPFAEFGFAVLVLFLYEIINSILIMAFLELASYAPFWLPLVFSTFGVSFLVLSKVSSTFDDKTKIGFFVGATVFGVANTIIYFVYDYGLAIAIYVFLLVLYLSIIVFAIAAMLTKKRK